MKVLFLSPQPFFIPRGTPIAVANLLKALEGQIEGKLLTFALGDDIEIPFEIQRLDRIPFTRTPPPGFSFTKFFYDLSMFDETVRVARKFDLIHGVEEANFTALFVKKLFGIPYVYDMDSILSSQLEGLMAKAAKILEKKALKQAIAVIAVSPSLAQYAEKFNRNVFLLPDTPYFHEFPEEEGLKEKLGWEGKFVFLYAGNFSSYQGIEFLIRAFKIAKKGNFLLALVGGKMKIDEPSIKVYPPVQPEEVNVYLKAADVLLSPRLVGVNTPMKIYSYLAAGKPIIASKIESHTQVLNSEVAVLLPLDERAWAESMEKLSVDSELRLKLGNAARQLFLEEYSWENFQKRVREIYEKIEKMVRGGKDKKTRL